MIQTVPTIDPNALLELREAALALGVNKATIQRLSNSGSLPFYVRKITGRRVWRGKDLIAAWKEMY